MSRWADLGLDELGYGDSDMYARKCTDPDAARIRSHSLGAGVVLSRVLEGELEVAIVLEVDLVKTFLCSDRAGSDALETLLTLLPFSSGEQFFSRTSKSTKCDVLRFINSSSTIPEDKSMNVPVTDN